MDRASVILLARVRCVLATLVLVLVAVLTGAGAAAQAAGRPVVAGSPTTAPAPSAIDRFGACVAGQHSGDILLLIDQSGSLAYTDRPAARVTAATYLVNQLEASAASDDQRIAVSIAGFADTYVPTLPWTALGPSTLPTITAAITGFRDKNTGFDTDYWSALDGARQALAARTVALGGAQRCQAIVLFTDGEIDIEARLTASERQSYGTTKPFSGSLQLTSSQSAATSQDDAISDICRSGGVADQIRAAGVETFAVGLSPPLTTPHTQPQNFSLLQSIATGQGSNGPGKPASRCGTLQSPSPGAFQTASGIDQLLFAFDKLSSPGQPAIQQTVPICQGSLCASAERPFVLDGSIDAVRVLATSPIANPQVYLQGPGGWKSVLVNHGTGSVQRVDHAPLGITYQWYSPNTLQIVMSAPAGASDWPGLWSVTFVDPSSQSAGERSESNIHISGDIYPTLIGDGGQMLRHGEIVRGLLLGLRTAAGQRISASSLLGKVDLSATLEPADGRPDLLAAGLTKRTLSDPIRADLSSVPVGPAKLVLTLQVTTRAVPGPHGQAGTTLSPESVAVPLTIAPPLDYPVVASHIDFGTIVGSAHSTGTVAVTGPGCVWLGGRADVVTGPSGVLGTASLTSTEDAPTHCLRLAVGQRLQLPIRLTTHGSGNGSLTGSFPIAVAPSVKGPVLVVRTTFVANLEKGLNSFHFLLALLAAIILGPGIPLLILYAVKWAGARIPAVPLCAETIPVSVVDGRLLRDGAEFELRDSDLVRNLVPLGRKGSRSVDTSGVTLRTRAGLRPTAQGFVVVESPARIGISSAKDPGPTKDGYARLPLLVQNHWVLLRDPAAPPDQASVLLLARSDATSASRAEMAADLRQRGPGVYADLRRIGTGDPEPTSPQPPTLRPPNEADLYG